MSKIVIAVDPGAKGAVVYRDRQTDKIVSWPYPSKDYEKPYESAVAMFQHLANISKGCNYKVAYFEAVSGFIGSPQPGSSMFQFGKTVGCQMMACKLAGFTINEVYPITWQKKLRLKADPSWPDNKKKLLWKNLLKQKAIDYSGLKATLADADAILMLQYAEIVEPVDDIFGDEPFGDSPIGDVKLIDEPFHDVQFDIPPVWGEYGSDD